MGDWATCARRELLPLFFLFFFPLMNNNSGAVYLLWPISAQKKIGEKRGTDICFWVSMWSKPARILNIKWKKTDGLVMNRCVCVCVSVWHTSSPFTLCVCACVRWVRVLRCWGLSWSGVKNTAWKGWKFQTVQGQRGIELICSSGIW